MWGADVRIIPGKESDTPFLVVFLSLSSSGRILGLISLGFFLQNKETKFGSLVRPPPAPKKRKKKLKKTMCSEERI